MPYKDRGKWRAVVRVGGKRVSQAFPTKAQATAWEAETRKMRGGVSRPLALFEIGDKFLAHVAATLQPKTLRVRTRALTTLFQAIDPTTPMDQVSPGQIHEHLAAQAKARTPCAANDDRASLLVFWNFAQRYYDIPKNPVKKVPPYPVEIPTQYTPPESDVAKLVAAASGEGRAWILSYLMTGAREQEINRLTWADVDFIGGRICLWSRKNSRHVLEPQWIPLAMALSEELKAWKNLTPYKDSPYVFPSPKTGGMSLDRGRMLKNLCRQAGIHPIPFHALRRFVGSILVKSGEPIRHVQVILRHQSLAHTERYVQGLSLDLTRSMEILGGLTTENTTRLKIVK